MDQLWSGGQPSWFWAIVPVLILLVYLRDFSASVRGIKEALVDAHKKQQSISVEVPPDLRRDLKRLSQAVTSIEEHLKAERRRHEQELQIEAEKELWDEFAGLDASRTCAQRLQLLRQFVEDRCGGRVYEADIPSEVKFAIPTVSTNQHVFPIMASCAYFVDFGESVLFRKSRDPAQPPVRPVVGRCFEIDLLGISDHDLDQLLHTPLSGVVDGSGAKRIRS